jgi:hypothetical protein
MKNIFIQGINSEIFDHFGGKMPAVDNVVYVPELFIKHLNDKRPYQIWRGSRYSAKSWTKAMQFLYKAGSGTYFRGVFARNTQKAARDSQFQLFKDLIKSNKYLTKNFTFTEGRMVITHNKTGHYIQGGSFEDPAALMSVPEITDFWAEEPISRQGSIQRSAFEDIAGTLRNSHGIIPQFHFTFNPIGKNNFIYEDFFGDNPKYDSSQVNDLVANYPDNPFCPPDRVEFLDHMAKTNPSRYLVDGKGLWGNPTNDSPWFQTWNPERHAPAGVRFAYGDYQTFLSFDFNNSPCTCTVYQLVPGSGIRGMRCYKANGGTRNLCQKMKLDAELMGVSKLYWTVTGDSNGKNYTSAAGNVSDYEIICDEFGISQRQLIGVHSRNKSLVYSRNLCNEFFDQVNFVMDERMEDLKNDLDIAYEDEKGNMYKNREDGYGMDFADNFRYFVHAVAPGGLTDIKVLAIRYR